MSIFPSDWLIKPLEDCLEILIDYRGKTPRKSASGIPLLSAKVIKGGRILDDIFEFLPEEDYDNWMRRGLPRVGDVVMTTEGPLGEIAQLDARKYALGQRIVTLRGKKGLLDNNYLKFIMQSSFIQDQLFARATGTTVLGIKQSELRKISMLLPSLPEQRAIAEILGSLDDKIEANRRENETLEATARAIFKSWFVDFDPVHAKSRGELPAGMDEETAQLFPDAFVESELGLIPQGWDSGRIRDIAYIDKSSINPAKSPDEVFWHYSLPAFDQGRMPKLETGGTIKSNKYLIPLTSVLLSKLNPQNMKVWLPMPYIDSRSISSTEFLVMMAKDAFTPEYLYCLFTSEDFIRIFSNLVTGTSSSHQRVKPDYLLEMNIVIPPIEILNRFNHRINANYRKVLNNQDESRTLAETRDALLPKLMSGEVRVGEL